MGAYGGNSEDLLNVRFIPVCGAGDERVITDP
jgi:hypothetical protein